jgi:hypothetical protein
VTSAMVLGAGVAGGRVLGATDDLAAPMTLDLMTGQLDGSQHLDYDNFVAGVLNLVGVDAGEHLPGSEPLHALQA